MRLSRTKAIKRNIQKRIWARTKNSQNRSPHRFANTSTKTRRSMNVRPKNSK